MLFNLWIYFIKAFQYNIVILLIYQVATVKGKSLEASYEFPRNMTDTDPNIQTWNLEVGQSTQTKTIQCFDGIYFGPFGSAENPNAETPNMILKKTYTNLPPHWSASFQAEMHGLWHIYNVPTTIYLDGDKQWYQKLYFTLKQMNQKVYGAAVEESLTCNNANITGLENPSFYPQHDMFIILFSNITHSNDSLEVKFEANFKRPWYEGSFAFSDIYIHVDTCHYSCKTCNGPTNDNCLTCPVNSVQTGQKCSCNAGYFASEWQCLQDTQQCQDGYQLNSNNVCQIQCPIEFCTSCVNSLCSVCFAGFYKLRGQCVEECPFYTTASGQDCVDQDEITFTKPYILCDFFIKNTITNQDFISSEFIYIPQTNTNPYSDGLAYEINSRVGEKCLGKNVVGGRGPDFYTLCNTLRKCKFIRSFTDLPPHYQIKIRFMAYIFDDWDNQYVYVYIDNTQAHQQYFPSAGTPGMLCGKPLQHTSFLDAFYEQNIVSTHSSTTLDLEITPKHNNYNSDESFGFRELSIILELCENPYCLTCSGPGQDCDSCQGLYRDLTNQCQCLPGYQDYYPIQYDCIQCSNDLCEICQNDSDLLCQICIGTKNEPKSRYTNECICPRGYYDNFQNNNLDTNCLECISVRCYDCIDGNSCQTCVTPDKRQGNQCECIDGYYDLSTQEDCVKCDIDCLTCFGGGSLNCIIQCQNKCLGCVGTDDGCIDCRGNREGSTCLCPDGYWETYQENCTQCHETCGGQCDKINSYCTGCMITRQLDITQPLDQTQCECDTNIPGIQDPALRTFYCTTCLYAVLDIKFSDDLSYIYIQFAIDIVIQGYNGFQQDAYVFQIDLCQHIFKQQTLDIIGEQAECRLNPDTPSLIEIKLGQGPLVIPLDVILLKSDIIERQTTNCIGTTFQNYILSEVQEPNQKLLPSLILQGPTTDVTICNEIIIQASEIVNDGGRGVFEFLWTLQSSDASLENQQKVMDLLQLASDSQQNFIKIPAIFLEIESNYIFSLSFINFVNTQGSVLFELNTLGKEGIYTQIIQTAPFVLKNYKINQFSAEVRYFDCKSGVLEEKDKALDTFWEVELPDNSIQNLQYKLTDPQSRLTIYNMPQYQFIPGNTYILKLKTEIPNGTEDYQKTYSQVNFKIIISELLVYIIGGSRSAAYNADLDIEGVAKDIDIALDLQTQGITYQWSCVNLSDPNPAALCTQIDGVELSMSTTTQLHFDAKSLEPYKSFLFYFEATNLSGNTNRSQVSVVIVESELPVLTVSIPENVIADEINTNDDLQIDIEYDGNPDDVFFSLTLFYKYDLVATKRQAYTSFSFKIWDLFSDFVGAENEILVRVSMYDPNFFMPSQSSYNLKINLPPRSGTLTIIPNQGLALDTQFQISLKGYFDINSPLSYKYHIYTNTQVYQDEKLQGETPINFKKHVLKDYTNENQLTTQLPQADFDINTNQQDMLIMVSISDSKGAVFNDTSIIQVNKPVSTIDDQLQNLQQQMTNINDFTKIQRVDKLIIYGLQLSQIENNQVQSNCNNQGVLQDNICICSSNYYALDCSMNNSQFQKFNILKKQIYSQLDSLQSIITSQATKDEIVKIMKLLIQGDGLTEQFSNIEIQSQLQQIQQIIEEKQIELNEIVNSGMWNTGDSQITRRQIKATGILGSFIGLLDKLQMDINKSYDNNGMQALSKNEIKQNLQVILNLQQSITNALQTSILPNSDKIQYQGQSTIKNIQKSTNQNIQDDYFSDINIMQGFNQQIQQQQFYNSQEENISKKVFKASQTVLKNNPYRLEDNYPYSDQNSQVQSIDISIDLNDPTNVKQPNIDIQKPITMAFDQIGDSTENNVCIQKNKENGQFDSKSCKTNIVENQNADGNILKCDCQILSPTTVVSDIQNLYTESNIEEVFSQDGIRALTQFKFQESVIFYTFCVLTVLFLFALFKGYKKDQKDKLQVVPLNQQKIQKLIMKEIQQEKKQQNDSVLFQNQEQKDILQNSQEMQKSNVKIPLDQFKQLNNQKKTFNLESSSESQAVLNQNQNNQQSKIQKDSKVSSRKRFKIKQQQLKKQQVIESNNSLVNIDNNNNENINFPMSNRSQKPILIDSPLSLDKQQQFIYPKLKNDIQDKNTNSNSSQDIEQNNQLNVIGTQQIKEKEQLEIIDKKLTKREEVIQFVLTLHQVLGIHYIFDPKISRPSRYSLIYTKISIVLAFSSTLASSQSQYYQILWSLVIGIVSAIPLAILKKLFQTNIIGKILAVLLDITLIGVSIFIAITNAALMEIEKSNEWAITYITSMVIDYFFIQILIGWFQLIIFNASIGRPTGQKLRKILSLPQQIQMQFVDLS